MTNRELKTKLSDSEILFLTIVGEARGEPVQGQIAVGNVILNRSKNRQESIADTCLQKSQFSCWNENDPNQAILIELTDKILYGSYGYDSYHQIKWIVDGLIGNELNDNTHGSNYYMTNSLFNSGKRPIWSVRIKGNITLIGNHTFFNI